MPSPSRKPWLTRKVNQKPGSASGFIRGLLTLCPASTAESKLNVGQAYQPAGSRGFPAPCPRPASALFRPKNWRLESRQHRQARKLLCRNLLINTRLQPGAKGWRGGKNRLNGFSFGHSWFTALKRGVNEMISTGQLTSLPVRAAFQPPVSRPKKCRCLGRTRGW